MAVEKELVKAVEQITHGKEEGFNVLYSHTYNYVYGRAKFIMKNEDDALDLTQETYIQAYKGIASLEDVNNLYAWLGGIVYRQGMMIYRKKKELLLDEGAEGIFDDIVSEDMDTAPEDSMQAKATSEIVMRMIEELPELQRAAVLAFYYDNIKIDDIAIAHNCSSNTIKSRLNYAKKYLKEKVEAHERQNKYKLCSVSPIVILMALKSLFTSKEYTMLPAVAESTYASVCGALGIKSSALLTGGMAAGSATTSTATAGAGMTSGTGAVVTTTAAKVGMSIGAKIAIGLTGLAVAGGIAAGVVMGTGSEKNDNDDNDRDIVNEMEYETSSDKPSVMITPDGDEIILDMPENAGIEFEEAFELWKGMWRSKYEYEVEPMAISLNIDGTCIVNGEECVWEKNSYENLGDYAVMEAHITLNDGRVCNVDMHINTDMDGSRTSRASYTIDNGQSYDLYSEDSYMDKINDYMGTWQADPNSEGIDEVELNADNTCVVGGNTGKWSIYAVSDNQNAGVADGLVMKLECDNGGMYEIYAYWYEGRDCDMWMSVLDENGEYTTGFYLGEHSVYEVITINADNWDEYFDIVESRHFGIGAADEVISMSLHQMLQPKAEYKDKIIDYASSLTFTVKQKHYSQEIILDYKEEDYILGEIIEERGFSTEEKSPRATSGDENGEYEYDLITAGYYVGAGLVSSNDQGTVDFALFDSFENIEGYLAIMY